MNEDEYRIAYEKLSNQQWLLTLYGRDKCFHTAVHDGTLSSYAYEFSGEPIIFAHKITKAEYLELNEIL